MIPGPRPPLAIGVLAVILSGCAPTVRIDGPLSPRPVASTFPGLRAGFGRADITPPAGVGLAGNGPGGRRARGYRLRLHARALVLEDSGGNRIALVVADLPLASALLHRRVAALTAARDSIGVDRLVIAVTHTHSGPGHHFEAAAYNEQGSAVVGYDPVLLDSLSRRIAAAVHAASVDLRPARAAWGSRRVWGATRIRSLPAILRNLPVPTPPADAPASLPLEYRLVDPTLTMLRVDQRDPASGRFRPAGAFSVFAMHGTGNGSANELLDADIHGIVERRLERHIDSSQSFVPKGFHLFANGAEGDVSPAWPPESRCDIPAMTPWRMLGGPLTNPLWQWQPLDDAGAAACLHAARRAVDSLGARIGEEAIALYESLGGSLDSRLELARSFVTVAMREDADSLGICSVPAVGTPLSVGADDAHTPFDGWRPLGLVSLGFEQGAANANGRGCHGAKRQLLQFPFGSLPNKLFVAGTLPRYAQLTVLRIGNRLIGTIPGEVTTTAGSRMQAGMRAAAREAGVAVDTAMILGLANGYINYVTTAEEYAAQYYEGGSTLYGPGEAAMLGRTLAELARTLSSGDALPLTNGRPLDLRPGRPRAILRRDPFIESPPATIERVWCGGDTLYADYRLGSVQDWPERDTPGPSRPNVEVLSDGRVLAWDDNEQVELHLRSFSQQPARWQLRWSGAGANPGARFLVRLRGRLESAPVQCPTPRRRTVQQR
jgi:neutral ceramidase